LLAQNSTVAAWPLLTTSYAVAQAVPITSFSKLPPLVLVIVAVKPGPEAWTNRVPVVAPFAMMIVPWLVTIVVTLACYEKSDP
jgi:hypothetical protein